MNIISLNINNNALFFEILNRDKRADDESARPMTSPYQRALALVDAPQRNRAACS